MKPSFALGFGDSNDFMDTRLAFHDFIAILSGDFEFKVFVTFGCYCLPDLRNCLHSPTLALCECNVHLTDILNEDSRLGASCARSELKIDFGEIIIGVGGYEKIDGGLFELLFFFLEGLDFLFQDVFLLLVGSLFKHFHDVVNVL